MKARLFRTLATIASTILVLLAFAQAPAPEADSLTFRILAVQPSGIGYLFTVRLHGALPNTQYVITSIHHTDRDYVQDTVTATTDSDGVASTRVWSRYTYKSKPIGYVFARLEQADILQAESNHLDCNSLCTINEYGSHLTADPSNNDWVYRPSPPGPGTVLIWVRSECSGLAGSIRIRSTEVGYSLPAQSLVEAQSGLYMYTWPIVGLTGAGDYRVQLTLSDPTGHLSGIDAFAKLDGRRMWVWGKAEQQENPPVWAILTNQDNDDNGIGERDEWLQFSHAPYGPFDPHAATSYLSIYPYITFSGTTVTGTLQAFLGTAHGTTDVRVEALAGSPRWVETDRGLQDGKDLCDAILDFNRGGSSADVRFDGIHYDVEHPNWFAERHWQRFVELLTHCQDEVDQYNQTYEPIVFGVDVPPRFKTVPESSGQIESGWDIMSIVDTITLMGYRDFADVRWDGRTDGIIALAEPFVVAGNALGTPVIIGVELVAASLYPHITFFEECPRYMEGELAKVSRHFAGDWAYRGFAVHKYQAWKEKSCTALYVPIALRRPSP